MCSGCSDVHWNFSICWTPRHRLPLCRRDGCTTKAFQFMREWEHGSVSLVEIYRTCTCTCKVVGDCRKMRNYRLKWILKWEVSLNPREQMIKKLDTFFDIQRSQILPVCLWPSGDYCAHKAISHPLVMLKGCQYGLFTRFEMKRLIKWWIFSSGIAGFIFTSAAHCLCGELRMHTLQCSFFQCWCTEIIWGVGQCCPLHPC